MNAVKALQRIRMLDELIDAKLAERDQLWDMVLRITQASDGMPHGGGVSDKVGDAVCRLRDLVREINVAVDRYVDHKAWVLGCLEKLPPNQYGTLHRLYVRYMSWEKTAEDMGKSPAQIARYRKNGIKNLQRVLNDSGKYDIM